MYNINISIYLYYIAYSFLFEKKINFYYNLIYKVIVIIIIINIIHILESGVDKNEKMYSYCFKRRN